MILPTNLSQFKTLDELLKSRREEFDEFIKEIAIKIAVKQAEERWRMAVAYNCEPEVIERINNAVKALTERQAGDKE